MADNASKLQAMQDAVTDAGNDVRALKVRALATAVRVDLSLRPDRANARNLACAFVVLTFPLLCLLLRFPGRESRENRRGRRDC